MGLDNQDLKKFYKNFNNMVRAFDKFLKDFLKENALDCLAKTKQRTPVDTGDLRRSWELSSVKKVGDNIEIHIINMKEYATYLENGHVTIDRKSWVYGYFMCTIPLEELERKLPRRFEKEFIQFVNRMGI